MTPSFPTRLSTDRGPHVVRGGVCVKSFTADPRNLAAYGAVTDRAGARRFDLEVTGEVRGAVLARIGGVEDRDAAETLRGTELYVERDRLPATAEDGFYHADQIRSAHVRNPLPNAKLVCRLLLEK